MAAPYFFLLHYWISRFQCRVERERSNRVEYGWRCCWSARPIPVEFEIHPKYAVNQKLPAVCIEARSRRRNPTQKMPAMPVVMRMKAFETCKCSSPPGTPRSTSKASNTSTTPKCEKHAMLPIADLPGAREKQCAPCSVCKARLMGRAPKIWRYCVPCFDIPNGKLVCVCSRKRETAETDDSCDLYHTRHPLDFISTHPEFRQQTGSSRTRKRRCKEIVSFICFFAIFFFRCNCSTASVRGAAAAISKAFRPIFPPTTAIAALSYSRAASSCVT